MIIVLINICQLLLFLSVIVVFVSYCCFSVSINLHKFAAPFSKLGNRAQIYYFFLIFTLIKTKLDVILWVLNRLGTGFG